MLYLKPTPAKHDNGPHNTCDYSPLALPSSAPPASTHDKPDVAVVPASTAKDATKEKKAKQQKYKSQNVSRNASLSRNVSQINTIDEDEERENEHELSDHTKSFMSKNTSKAIKRHPRDGSQNLDLQPYLGRLAIQQPKGEPQNAKRQSKSQPKRGVAQAIMGQRQ